MVAWVGNACAGLVLAIARRNCRRELQRQQEHEDQHDITHGVIVEVRNLQSRVAASLHICAARSQGNQFCGGWRYVHGLKSTDSGATDVANGQSTCQMS